MNNLLKNILSDLRVDLTDHFDKNFSRGGFFGKKWKPRKDGVAIHLNNTGTLRRGRHPAGALLSPGIPQAKSTVHFVLAHHKTL